MRPTAELRRALKSKFFSYAADRGFALDDRSHPGWTTFRRRSGNRVQLFQVQWDKYGRPRFVVHFGTCPAEGLEVDGAVFPAEETLPTWCADAGTLQPLRGTSTRSWFRQDSTFFERLRGRPHRRAPSVVVDELLTLFPELEQYWATGELGPHLKLWHRHPVLPKREDH